MPQLDHETERRVLLFGLPALALIVIAVVLALLDAGPFSGGETEADRVAATVERFVEAGNQRDFKTTCKLLSREALAEARIDEIAKAFSLRGPDACARVLQARTQDTGEGEVTVEVTDVRISGNRAAADVIMKRPDEPNSDQTIQLALERGEWKVSSSG